MKKIILYLVLITLSVFLGCDRDYIDSENYANELDKLTSECNIACCGEAFPADCENECIWPGYMDCFNNCEKENYDSESCDFKCWPEHKKWLIEKKGSC